MSIKSVIPSNHSFLCHPLFLLPSIFLSIRVFSNKLFLCIRWPPKYWSFSFSINISNKYSGLISFRIDCLDLLGVQVSSATPQFKNINSSVLSHLYGPTLTSVYYYQKNHNWLYGPLLAKWCLFFLLCGPLEIGMANYFNNLCLENPMNNMKRQ